MHVDSTEESPVILSLCTGIRGLERGVAELADTGFINAQRSISEQPNEERWSIQGERPSGSQSSCERWPARPGQQQHGWEEKRVSQSGVGNAASRNENRNSIYDVDYEIYATDKTNAAKALHELWNRINQKADEWTFGGLFSFLETEILYSPMLCKIKNSRLSVSFTSPETIFKINEVGLRKLWKKKIAECPSHRRQLFEQLKTA